ncbi:MAG: hypothetical protein KJ000_19790 [Pirellulaceae bacterium]|nr:hypothetical protein [Pirellulaceae bacterium]
MSRPMCMFCGGEIESEELTMEHFVPKCLWEKGHRPDKTKTLPAHKDCNNAFSEDNEYFRDVIVMEEGAERHPEGQRVREGAIQRKLNERFGSIVKSLKNLRMRRVYTPTGIYLGNRPTFEVEWERFERVLCNVIKGVFYVARKQPLPRDFIISVSDIRTLDPEWVTRTVSFMVPWQSFGDSAFCCRYVVSSKKPIEKITCLMQFYENRLFLGEAVSPKVFGDDGDVFVPVRDGASILVPRWTAER